MLATAELDDHAGLTRPRRSPAVLTFSAMMFRIADLDRPFEGRLQVSQHAMIDLRNSFEGSAP